MEENDFWPEKWHKMPLGHFIHSIRDGDIDAKDHWLRRPVLDRIRFNWGDGLRHLSFTWELLMKGIYWYVKYSNTLFLNIESENRLMFNISA